jgi:hypothetical protein
MTAGLGRRTRWWVVVVFAVAMAWFEAATVYYLRVLVDRVTPYQPNPLPLRGVLGEVELVREAATLVMLLTLGMLAGATWRARLGYTAIAFGVWDILYYVFLRLMSGWPQSLFDWDILFLLPLPWWGPVLAPVCIAVLMIVWGTQASLSAGDGVTTGRTRTVWSLSALGIVLALYVFMADALRLAGSGEDAVRNFLPVEFNWPVFCAALALMATSLLETYPAYRLPPRRYILGYGQQGGAGNTHDRGA